MQTTWMNRVKYRNKERGKVFCKVMGRRPADEPCTAIQKHLGRGIQSGKSLGARDSRQGMDVMCSWVREQTCLSRMANLPSLQPSTVVTALILACFLDLWDSKPGVLLALSKVLKIIVPSRRSYWLPELHQLLQRYVHEHGSLWCLEKCDMYRERKLTALVVFFFLELRGCFSVVVRKIISWTKVTKVIIATW